MLMILWLMLSRGSSCGRDRGGGGPVDINSEKEKKTILELKEKGNKKF